MAGKTTKKFQVVKVETLRGKVQWGYLLEESAIGIRLAYPLGEDATDDQMITIPWTSIEGVFTEDEESAPWMLAPENSPTS
jgi:hypothetical protein